MIPMVVVFASIIGFFSMHSQIITIGAVNKVSPVTESSDQIKITSPEPDSSIPSRFSLTAALNGSSTDAYDMFWYVDNGTWNWMTNGSSASDTKAAEIDVSSWNWHKPSDRYAVYVVAVMHETGKRYYKSVPINVSAATQTVRPNIDSKVSGDTNITQLPPSTPQDSVAPSASIPSVTATAPISKPATVNPANLYVNPQSNASRAALTASNPVTKRIMARLASTPSATWYGDWNASVRSDVNTVVTAASSQQQVPVLVTYNIPGRDCGSYSAGGAATITKYQDWIKEFSAGIANRQAIVILEPDAVPQMDCLSQADQSARYQLLNFAVSTLKANNGTKVYIDAGNSKWKPAAETAKRLNLAGITNSDGFSLNVSNFLTTSESSAYGRLVSAGTSGKHFIVDTSRNGVGANAEWCNPSGRALGAEPTTQTGDPLVDYLLWIKAPGESDGTCNGGPTAGVWWSEYVEALALKAGW